MTSRTPASLCAKHRFASKVSLGGKRFFSLGLGLAISGLALWSSPDASAAVRTWTGNTTANLNAVDGFDAVPTTGDSFTFNVAGTAGATLNNNLAAGFSVAGITFNAGASAYTINGNAFSLTSVGVINSSSNSQTFGTAITLGTATSDTVINTGATAGGNTLTFNGGITYGTSRLFTATNAGNIVLNGAGTGAGRGGVAVFSLTAANNTQISGYAIRVNNAGTVLTLGNATALGTGAYQANVATETIQSNTNLTGANAVGNTLVLSQNQFIGGTNAIEFSGTSTSIGTGAAGSAGAIITTGASRSLFITNTAATTISGRVALSDDAAATGRVLTVDVAGTAGGTTISGAIVDYVGANGTGTGGVAGSLTKANSGILTLTGTNTYTGTTTVSAGSLYMNGTHNQGTGANAGRYVVSTGATLGGNGTINLSDTNGGTTGISISGVLAPGASANTIGTLTINGTNSVRAAVSLETGGTLTFDLGASLTSDRLALTGVTAGTADLFFNNNTINFNNPGGGTLANGQYTLITADATGAYSGLTVSGTTITAGLTIGTGLAAYPGSTLNLSGNNIVLTVVPEPGTWAAMCVGLGACGVMFAKRRLRRGDA